MSKKSETNSAGPDLRMPESIDAKKGEEARNEAREKRKKMSLKLSIDPVGVVNLTRPELKQVEIREGNYIAYSDEVNSFAIQAAVDYWNSKDPSKNFSILSIGFDDYLQYKQSVGLSLETADVADMEQRFNAFHRYFSFLESGEDISSFEKHLKTEDADLYFLAIVGQKANSSYDFDRKGKLTSSIVGYDKIFDSLKARWRMENLMNIFNKAYTDYLDAINNAREGNKEIDALRQSIDNLAEFLGTSSDKLLDGKTLDNTSFDANTLMDMAASEFKKKYASGVCRDIAVYQAYLADKLGIKDSFSTSINSQKQGGHLIHGGRLKNGRFYFLDYGNIYMARSKNISDALAEYEQNVAQNVALTYLISRGADQGSNLVVVKTRAGEQLASLARGKEENLSEQTGENIRLGNVALQNGMELKLTRTNLEIGATYETFQGATKLKFSKIDNSSDRYNSIRQAVALHLSHHFEFGKGKNYALDVGATYAHAMMKSVDKKGKPIRLEDVLMNLNPEFADRANLTNSLQLRYAAGLEALIALDLESDYPLTSYNAGFSGALQLAYVTQEGELYFGIQSDNKFVLKNIRDAITPSVYPEQLDLRLGGKYRATRVEVEGEVGAGPVGLKHGARVYGDVGLSIDKKYYLEMKGQYIAPRTFLVLEEIELKAKMGMKVDEFTMLNAEYYLQNESNHKPEQGATVGVEIVF